MRRRDFIKVMTAAAAAWPHVARAQQGESMRRVGILLPYREGDAEGQAVVAAFQEGPPRPGLDGGRNVHSDIRWASGDPDKARSLAKELIGMAPDVIAEPNLITTIVQQENPHHTGRLHPGRRSVRQRLCLPV